MRYVYNHFAEPEHNIGTSMNIVGNDLYIRDFIVKPIMDDGGAPNSITSDQFLDTVKNMRGDINVWINSKGGELGYSLSIYNALMEHEGKVTTIVEGYAYSCASWIMLAGSERQITSGGIVMTHNPIINAVVNSETSFDKVMPQWRASRDSIANIISDRTGKPKEEVYNLMDAQTFMTADEAIKQGFCTKKREGRALIPSGVRNYLPSEISTAIPEVQNAADCTDLLSATTLLRAKKVLNTRLTGT